MRRSVVGLRVEWASNRVYSNLEYSLGRTWLGLPDVRCNDTQVTHTLQNWSFVEEPGCLSRVVYGPGPALYLTAFMCMSTLSLARETAMRMGFFVVLGWVIIAVCNGQNRGSAWATLTLMVVAGAVETLQSHLKCEAERKNFIAKKAHVFAAEKQRRLLHTLIPPSVLDLLADNTEVCEGALCAQVDTVTIMFCKFTMEIETKEHFNAMGRLIRELDLVVEESEMYKYQHISCGSDHYYIVACPRVLSPFGPANQQPTSEGDRASQPEYPPEFSAAMVQLGLDLIEVTRQFEPGGLVLSVGIHSGPVACVILGKCRRFYCLYGSTVNQAARMCQSALVPTPDNAGSICTSQRFCMQYAEAQALCGDLVVIEPRETLVDIKGLGPTQVYDCHKVEGERPTTAVGNELPEGHVAGEGRQGGRARRASLMDEVALGLGDLKGSPEIGRVEGVSARSRRPSLMDAAMGLGTFQPGFRGDGGAVGAAGGGGWRETKKNSRAEGKRAASSTLDRETAHTTDTSDSGFMSGSQSNAGYGDPDVTDRVKRKMRQNSEMSWRHQFVSREREEAFAAAQAEADRVSLSAGLVLHAACSIWQGFVVLCPDSDDYFSGHGVSELERGAAAAAVLLGAHMTVVVLSCLALGLVMWRPEAAQLARCMPARLRSTGGGSSSERAGDGVRARQGAAPSGYTAQGALHDTAAAHAENNEDTTEATVLVTAPARATIDKCVYGYVLLKVLFFAVSITALQMWRSQIAIFTVFAAGNMFNFGISHCNYGVSWATNAGLVLISVAVLLPFYVARGLAGFNSANAYMACQATGSLVVSALVCRSRRQMWTTHQYFSHELKRLVFILQDLMPPTYAAHLLDGYGSMAIPSSDCHVVALQLDIVGFTALSQTLAPIDLAETINTLFSEFDEAVMLIRRACVHRCVHARIHACLLACKRAHTHTRIHTYMHTYIHTQVLQQKELFKVDTMGDAYIVVSFLDRPPDDKGGMSVAPGAKARTSGTVAGNAGNRTGLHRGAVVPQEQDESQDLESGAHTEVDPQGTWPPAREPLQQHRLCAHATLRAAGVMLERIRERQRSTGFRLDARIGIAVGSAVAGILGELQPRFSVQGPVMRAAAQLETTGEPGAVHCSRAFAELVPTAQEGPGNSLTGIAGWISEPRFASAGCDSGSQSLLLRDGALKAGTVCRV